MQEMNATFTKLNSWNKRRNGLPGILVRYLDKKFLNKDYDQMYILNWVNVFINGYTYMPDKWDYWKTIVEFIASRGGDCEDKQLAKFEILVYYFGFKPKDFKLWLVYDKQEAKAHAILSFDNLILDNQVRSILPVESLIETRYDPLFVFNMETLEEVELGNANVAE